jgi:hypothetical protein
MKGQKFFFFSSLRKEILIITMTEPVTIPREDWIRIKKNPNPFVELLITSCNLNIIRGVKGGKVEKKKTTISPQPEPITEPETDPVDDVEIPIWDIFGDDDDQ